MKNGTPVLFGVVVALVLVAGVCFWWGRSRRMPAPTMSQAQQEQAERYYRERVLPLKSGRTSPR